MIKKNRQIAGVICFCVLISLVGWRILHVYNMTQNYYRDLTKYKLTMIYNGILIYVQEYGKYPPNLKTLAQEAIVNEQQIYDIKILNPLGAVFKKSRTKKLTFLYNPHLKYDKNQIIVAEPMAVDNMRYVIYTKKLNEFKKSQSLLKPFYFKSLDDSVKRISETKFQKQAKKQGWKI